MADGQISADDAQQILDEVNPEEKISLAAASHIIEPRLAESLINKIRSGLPDRAWEVVEAQNMKVRDQVYRLLNPEITDPAAPVPEDFDFGSPEAPEMKAKAETFVRTRQGVLTGQTIERILKQDRKAEQGMSEEQKKEMRQKLLDDMRGTLSDGEIQMLTRVINKESPPTDDALREDYENNLTALQGRYETNNEAYQDASKAFYEELGKGVHGAYLHPGVLTGSDRETTAKRGTGAKLLNVMMGFDDELAKMKENNALKYAPEKEKAWVKKQYEKYQKLPRWKRVGMSALVGTGVATGAMLVIPAAFGALTVSAPLWLGGGSVSFFTGTSATIGSYAGISLLKRSLIGFLGGATGELAQRKIVDPKFEGKRKETMNIRTEEARQRSVDAINGLNWAQLVQAVEETSRQTRADTIELQKKEKWSRIRWGLAAGGGIGIVLGISPKVAQGADVIMGGSTGPSPDSYLKQQGVKLPEPTAPSRNYITQNPPTDENTGDAATETQPATPAPKSEPPQASKSGTPTDPNYPPSSIVQEGLGEAAKGMKKFTGWIGDWFLGGDKPTTYPRIKIEGPVSSIEQTSPSPARLPTASPAPNSPAITPGTAPAPVSPTREIVLPPASASAQETLTFQKGDSVEKLLQTKKGMTGGEAHDAWLAHAKEVFENKSANAKVFNQMEKLGYGKPTGLKDFTAKYDQMMRRMPVGSSVTVVDGKITSIESDYGRARSGAGGQATARPSRPRVPADYAINRGSSAPQTMDVQSEAPEPPKTQLRGDNTMLNKLNLGIGEYRGENWERVDASARVKDFIAEADRVSNQSGRQPITSGILKDAYDTRQRSRYGQLADIFRKQLTSGEQNDLTVEEAMRIKQFKGKLR